MGSFPEIKKILCPVDLGERCLRVAQEAAYISQATGAELIVLNVINEKLFEDLERYTGRIKMFDGLTEHAYAALEDDHAEQLKGLIKASGMAERVHKSIVSIGAPWEKILETAEEEEADLIINGGQGPGQPGKTDPFRIIGRKNLPPGAGVGLCLFGNGI